MIELWGISRPIRDTYGKRPGREVYIPYPGSYPVGSREAAERQANPNHHNGYRVVRLECRIVEEIEYDG